MKSILTVIGLFVFLSTSQYVFGCDAKNCEYWESISGRRALFKLNDGRFSVFHRDYKSNVVMDEGLYVRERFTDFNPIGYVNDNVIVGKNGRFYYFLDQKNETYKLTGIKSLIGKFGDLFLSQERRQVLHEYDLDFYNTLGKKEFTITQKRGGLESLYLKNTIIVHNEKGDHGLSFYSQTGELISRYNPSSDYETIKSIVLDVLDEDHFVFVTLNHFGSKVTVLSVLNGEPVIVFSKLFKREEIVKYRYLVLKNHLVFSSHMKTPSNPPNLGDKKVRIHSLNWKNQAHKVSHVIKTRNIPNIYFHKMTNNTFIANLEMDNYIDEYHRIQNFHAGTLEKLGSLELQNIDFIETINKRLFVIHRDKNDERSVLKIYDKDLNPKLTRNLNGYYREYRGQYSTDYENKIRNNSNIMGDYYFVKTNKNIMTFVDLKSYDSKNIVFNKLLSNNRPILLDNNTCLVPTAEEGTYSFSLTEL